MFKLLANFYWKTPVGRVKFSKSCVPATATHKESTNPVSFHPSRHHFILGRYFALLKP